MKPLADLARDLAAGRTSSRQLVEECLDRIADESGEGARAFISTAPERARTAADAIDAMRAQGAAPTPYAGIPIAIKDLADVAGEVTAAGSRALADNPPASADAPAVARLRAAGFVLLGRTNMTEFAFSGLGLNPHYGTPLSPYDRETGRIPGGSSSGTAVAVADGMAAMGLGTDTGGSCRIPAAFCGVTGYKPTATRVPLEGIVPLSPSMDAVGPLAPTVECCAIGDAILAGDLIDVPQARPLRHIKLAAIQDFVLNDLDDAVAAAFETALKRLRAAGVDIVDIPFPELNDLPAINAKGGLAAAEAHAWHRDLLERKGNLYDQRVRARIANGVNQNAADYIDLLDARRRLIAASRERLAGFDAFVLPSVALIPPTIASLERDEDYIRTNMLCLRNTAVGNFLDSCAISLPIHAPGEAPVGLMLQALAGQDRDLFSVALAVEGALETR